MIPPVVTVEDVYEHVAACLKVPVALETVRSNSRAVGVVAVRWAVAYIANTDHHISYPDVARFLRPGRGHTQAVAGSHAVKRAMAAPQYASDVAAMAVMLVDLARARIREWMHLESLRIAASVNKPLPRLTETVFNVNAQAVIPSPALSVTAATDEAARMVLA